MGNIKPLLIHGFISPALGSYGRYPGWQRLTWVAFDDSSTRRELELTNTFETLNLDGRCLLHRVFTCVVIFWYSLHLVRSTFWQFLHWKWAEESAASGWRATEKQTGAAEEKARLGVSASKWSSPHLCSHHTYCLSDLPTAWSSSLGLFWCPKWFQKFKNFCALLTNTKHLTNPQEFGRLLSILAISESYWVQCSAIA